MPPRKVPCSRFAMWIGIAAARPAHRPRSFPRPLTSRSELPIATSDPELVAAVEAAAIAEGLSVRTLAGDLSDAVVVMDVDDDGGASRSVDRSAGVLGVTRRAVPSLPIAGSPTGSCCPRRSPTSERSSGPPCCGKHAVGWRHRSRPTKSVRLATLHGLGLLDTPREERFDRLVERRPARSPRRRSPWCRWSTRSDNGSRPRPVSMPSRAIETSRSAHTRSSAPTSSRSRTPWRTRGFADNPVVAGPIRVRFYAGVPLALADGSRVGTLCVADHRPRRLDDRAARGPLPARGPCRRGAASADLNRSQTSSPLSARASTTGP